MDANEQKAGYQINKNCSEHAFTSLSPYKKKSSSLNLAKINGKLNWLCETAVPHYKPEIT